MKTNLFFLVMLFCCSYAYCQNVEKVFLNSADTSATRYIAVIPQETEIKGFLFLLPSFGEMPEEVLNNTDIPQIAAKNGILTIIPVFSTGSTSIGIDEETQQSFKEMLNQVVNKYQLQTQKLFVGGFSIGGSTAVKFAEQTNLPFGKPAAVFALDPPLDFERLYNSSKRMLRLSVNSSPSKEATYLIERLEKEMEGTPEEAIQNYHKMSPYSFSDKKQSAIKNLVNTPIRIYTEPDITWFVNRGMDFYSMNAFDATAMINELKKLGNEKAELISTSNKGYRDGEKHPHSWSIADPTELVNWLLKQ